MPRPSASLLRWPGKRSPGRAEEDGLLAVAREARLHEELDVAAPVGAGHVEAGGAPSRAVAQQVLDEPEADVAGLAVVDGVELDDRPLIAGAVALDARQAGQSAVLLVDVQLVMGLEGPQRHAEEAEDRDVAGRHRQAERSRRTLRSLLPVSRRRGRPLHGRPRPADGQGATARPARRGR